MKFAQLSWRFVRLQVDYSFADGTCVIWCEADIRTTDQAQQHTKTKCKQGTNL